MIIPIHWQLEGVGRALGLTGTLPVEVPDGHEDGDIAEVVEAALEAHLEIVKRQLVLSWITPAAEA